MAVPRPGRSMTSRSLDAGRVEVGDVTGDADPVRVGVDGAADDALGPSSSSEYRAPGSQATRPGQVDAEATQWTAGGALASTRAPVPGRRPVRPAVRSVRRASRSPSWPSAVLLRRRRPVGGRGRAAVVPVRGRGGRSRARRGGLPAPGGGSWSAVAVLDAAAAVGPAAGGASPARGHGRRGRLASWPSPVTSLPHHPHTAPSRGHPPHTSGSGRAGRAGAGPPPSAR